jgi:hypothetical protein
MVVVEGNFSLGCGPGTDYPQIQIVSFLVGLKTYQHSLVSHFMFKKFLPKIVPL